jgi:hypothetical protein
MRISDTVLIVVGIVPLAIVAGVVVVRALNGQFVNPIVVSVFASIWILFVGVLRFIRKA